MGQPKAWGGLMGHSDGGKGVECGNTRLGKGEEFVHCVRDEEESEWGNR